MLRDRSKILLRVSSFDLKWMQRNGSKTFFSLHESFSSLASLVNEQLLVEVEEGIYAQKAENFM